MKRVLHCIDTTGPGGAETVFMTLASRLDPLRYKSYVAIAGKGWLYDELCRKGFRPYIVGGKRGFDFNYLKRLIDVIRSNRIDLVQSHLFGSNVYCSIAGALMGVPVVCTYHGNVDVGSHSFLRFLKLKIVNRYAARVVCVSKSLEKELAALAHLPARKSVVIYNGVDVEQFKRTPDNSIRKKLGFADSDFVVGAVGNIRPAKNYKDLILTAAALVGKSPRYKVVIAGQGDGSLYDELQKQIRALMLEKNVYFIGYQDNVQKFLNNLDVFVLCSSTEGFSIATIEAMACELPVVATRCGGPEEILVNEKDGILVKLGDTQKLVDAIHRISEDRNYAQKLRYEARLAAQDRFSVDSMVSAYELIYQTI